MRSTAYAAMRMVMPIACVAALAMMGGWAGTIAKGRPSQHAGIGWVDSYEQGLRLYPLAAGAISSGFRGLAADLLWLKADQYWHHGQWHRMLPLYRLIVAIQPRFTIVWSVGGWHMAYNLSARALEDTQDSSKAAAQSRKWVDQGILFMEEGLRYNGEKPDLYFDLGWTYFDRMGDYFNAVHYLEQSAQRNPRIATLRALAHAYRKAGMHEEALGVWEGLAAAGDAAALRWMKRLRQ